MTKFEYSGILFGRVENSISFSLHDADDIFHGNLVIPADEINTYAGPITQGGILTGHAIVIDYGESKYIFKFDKKHVRDSLFDCLGEKINEILKERPNGHHVVNVCNNGDHTTRYVDGAELAATLQYDIIFRPGKALFLDSCCLSRGYLDKERCDKIEKEIMDGGYR